MTRRSLGVASIAASASILLARRARACLNDFEITMAEQQLRGAYAAPASTAPEIPYAEVLAGLGAVALVWALIRAARAA